MAHMGGIESYLVSRKGFSVLKRNCPPTKWEKEFQKEKVEDRKAIEYNENVEHYYPQVCRWWEGISTDLIITRSGKLISAACDRQLLFVLLTCCVLLSLVHLLIESSTRRINLRYALSTSYRNIDHRSYISTATWRHHQAVLACCALIVPACCVKW